MWYALPPFEPQTLKQRTIRTNGAPGPRVPRWLCDLSRRRRSLLPVDRNNLTPSGTSMPCSTLWDSHCDQTDMGYFSYKSMSNFYSYRPLRVFRSSNRPAPGRLSQTPPPAQPPHCSTTPTPSPDAALRGRSTMWRTQPAEPAATLPKQMLGLTHPPFEWQDF